MCNKAILENGWMLDSVPDWYKTQNMCDKDVDHYAHVLEFVPDCYKTQKCVINAPECSKAQKMKDKLLISVFFCI